jgi:hypothetical protein
MHMNVSLAQLAKVAPFAGGHEGDVRKTAAGQFFQLSIEPV